MDHDCPSIVESDASSLSSIPEDCSLVTSNRVKREPLQWVFKGLTLWLEFEEFDRDLSRANEIISTRYGTETIPTVHATAIYGMEHLSDQEAIDRLNKVREVLPEGQWPKMERPVAVKQDIAQEGLPGQVCSISWAELTLRTNHHHEEAMDALCEMFEVGRQGPWTPHISLAYDNPEDTVLSLGEIVSHVASIPTLLQKERRVLGHFFVVHPGENGGLEMLGQSELAGQLDNRDR